MNNKNLGPGPIPGNCSPMNLTKLHCPACDFEALEVAAIEYAMVPGGGCENLAAFRCYCGSCWKWEGLLVIHNHKGTLEVGLVACMDDRSAD